jgi:hypothetical protein
VEPPFPAVAVNTTLCPRQIVVEGFAVILTLAGNAELTDIVIALDVAGDPVMQDAVDVMLQVIISLFAKAVDEYVEFVAPETFVPFFFH